MKKLLALLTLVLVLASCGTQKTESDYLDYCKTDSIVIGYSYAFLFNDSADMNMNIFNPIYKEMLSNYENLTYAASIDEMSARGYWGFLQGLDKGVPELPKMSKEIKIPTTPSWLGYVEWKEGR